MDDTQIASIVSDFREGIQGSVNLYHKLRIAATERDAALARLAALVTAAQPIIDAHYDPGILPASVTAGMIADLERAVAMAQKEI